MRLDVSVVGSARKAFWVFVLGALLAPFGLLGADTTPPPPRPIVSIVASQPATSEPSSIIGVNALVAPGRFTISRTGSVDAALLVYLGYEGTATRGMDYNELPYQIEIPAGHASVDLEVKASLDSIKEGDETVVARFAMPPTASIIIPYDIDPNQSSATVTIHDVPPVNDLPILSITAPRPATSEPSPNVKFASGLFAIHRTGPTNNSLTAYLSITGTATSGADYTELPTSITFIAGQMDVRLEVVAHSDDLVEGDESVVIELIQPPTASPVALYNIDPDHHNAVVTIHDANVAPEAYIKITDPEEGAVVPTGGAIKVKAVAVDPNGYLPHVEFFSDDVSIGVSDIAFLVAPTNGTPIYHEIEWSNIPAGPHKLTARATTQSGQPVVSQIVNVFAPVIDPPPPPVVSIRTVHDMTLRPIPNADYASDFFEISRTGPTNEPLDVYFSVPLDGDHIATPDVDYHALQSPVTIPAGSFTTYMRVDAIDDELVEGPEIVRVKLISPPVNIAPGGFTYYMIDLEHASADVTIMDNDQGPAQVTLAVEVPDGVASEISPTTTPDTATFLIRRVSGPTNVPVTVYYQMSGTAKNGDDYKELSGTVELPEGADHVNVEIVPIADNIVEGEETVVFTLVPPICPAIFPPPPDCYLIGEHDSGRAVIVDQRDMKPAVKFLQPVNGAVFSLGEVIKIEAQAWDHEGDIAKLEVLADGNSLSDTNGNHLVTVWNDAAVGQHSLVAKATDGSGQVATTEIHILVRGSNADAFVMRKLPPAYTPGTLFFVELRAEPPSSARAYAVEDHPPTNWVVTDISNDGVYDPATGKVKFGPFTDANARTLTYSVTPPNDATGRKEFSGVGSIDGVNYRIGGDRLIAQTPTEHPADTNKDFSIVVDEVTSYAGAWKGGDTNIPISYVTRAGFIWKHGEAYQFDGSKAPPLCWVPTDGGTIAQGAATVSGDSDPSRSGDGQTQPGASATLKIHILPPAGTSAYALEEHVPIGWAVTKISDDGSFDPTTGIIRWGVFFDATERTFSYTLTPPAAVVCVAHIFGRVSFDGVVKEIGGGDQVTSSDDPSRPTLTKCDADGSGKVHVELSGGAGQVGVLQSSTDLVHWQDITTLYLPDGSVQFDDDANPAVVRYYRLQVR